MREYSRLQAGDESGRGYPSLEALRHLAETFDVSIDDLLSTNELAMMTEKNQKQERMQNISILYGILDLLALSYFFLPLCGMKTENGSFVQVSLLAIPSSPIRTSSIVIIATISLYGLAELLLQVKENTHWKRLVLGSVLIHALAILFLSLCHQPYMTATLFLFFLAKLAFLLRQKAFSA